MKGSIKRQLAAVILMSLMGFGAVYAADVSEKDNFYQAVNHASYRKRRSNRQRPRGRGFRNAP